jgi:MOSC domain-containing protein YiiM
MTGKMVVEHIFVAPRRGAPQLALDRVEALEETGLRGDRYTAVRSKFSLHHQVTLIEAENIEAFNKSTGHVLTPDMPRRNLVTRGIRLNDLVGRRFIAGGALLEGMELCEPCRLFASRSYPEVVEALAKKGGLRARIVASRIILVGDGIEVID